MKVKNFLEFITEKKISRHIPLPQDIKEISEAYIKSGKDIFVVGGAVRDFIQGIKPKDYDLVTNALPNESKKILKDFNVSDEQGKSFGVLRVYTKDEPEGYEIASYRKDISKGRDTKGNDEKVEMGKGVTIQDDCNRRDLTMNALFYDIKNKEIVDLVGGVDDIKNGIVRSVGNPSERFLEDRLRILRIFRFTARTGGVIDKETSKSIKNDNRLKGISVKDDVSQERIWEEMKKAFKQSKNYNDYLNLFTEYNMWKQVFHKSDINTNLMNSSNFVIIISNLFKNEKLSEIEEKLVQDYKIETDLVKKIKFLISMLDFNSGDVFDIYKKKKQSFIKDSTILEWLKVNNIKNKLAYKFLDYKPSVSAKKLMDKRFKGAELGKEIKRLEKKKFKNEK